MMKLTWHFKEADGYSRSIMYAVDENDVHVAHINMTSTEYGLMQETYFFGTIKVMEDDNRLGGEGGRETIQESMDDVQYYFDHGGKFPDGYYAGM